MKTLKRTCTAIALVISSMLASLATADTTEILRTKDGTAQALFVITDGCLQTFTTVIGVANAQRVNSTQPTLRSTATVAITTVNTCDFTTKFQAFGVSENALFSLKGGVSTQKLQATVNLQDIISGQLLAVTVNMTWKGVGEVFVNESRNITQNGNITTEFRFKGKTQFSSAVGTVSDGAINYTPPTAEQPAGFTAVSFGVGEVKTTIKN